MLLSMIEERKLSVNEVSLAAIAEEYIEHVRGLEEFPEREAAQFLVIAATLMLIKSRSLLPQLELETEEEADIKELEMRLTQLRFFRGLAKGLGGEAAKKNFMYSRDTLYGFEITFLPPEKLGIPDIVSAAHRIIASIPKEDSLPEKMIERIITIEEKIEELRNRIQKNAVSSFTKLAGSKDKTEVIVSFLALLELLKTGIIFAEQKGIFEDIHVKHVHANKEILV